MPDHAPDEQQDDAGNSTGDYAADYTSDPAAGAENTRGPGAEQDGVIIPRPRPPLDDSPVLDLPPSTTPDNRPESAFRYDQTWLRGKRRRYHGQIEWIGGVEGERLREDLAAAVRDLLGWAARDNDPGTTEPGPEAEGGETS